MRWLLGILFLFHGMVVMAQDTDLSLIYTKVIPDQFRLEVTLENEDGEPVGNVPVKLFLMNDTIESPLSEVTLGPDGYGKFAGSLEDLGESHIFNFKALFEGYDTLLSSNTEITIQDSNLEVMFEIVDSVKTIEVQFSGWDEEGNEVMLEDGEIYFYVPRLFGLLPVGDVYTDEDGYDMMEFPDDIPGDEGGIVTIIAKIEDSDEWGNIESSYELQWGLATDLSTEETPRSLTGSRPPIWMLVTFIILMISVWFHYGWIFVNMRSISTEGKKTEEMIWDETELN